MAAHIKKMTIDSYRGINDLEIGEFGKVNIFVGDNNVGKTSVLEAIQILCSPNEYNLINIARQRENVSLAVRTNLGILESFTYIFDINSEYKKDDRYYIGISGEINGVNGKVEVEGTISKQIVDMAENERYRHLLKYRSGILEQEEIQVFIGLLRETFNNTKEILEIDNWRRMIMDENNKLLNFSFIRTADYLLKNPINRILKDKEIKDFAVNILKEFDEDIADIRYIPDDNRYIPTIETIHGEYIPLSLYGDGMRKVINIINSMANMENGVVLIDEFENGIHTSVMNTVFKFMLDMAEKLNIQLFLTTHSIEAVDKLLMSAETDLNDLKLIRLRKKNGKIFPKVLSGEKALENRRIYDMELRV